MGTIIFFTGFIAMVVSFVVALIQYNKLKRMDLTVMCFMLSLAVMVSGVTASVLDGAFRSRTDAEQERAAAEAKKEKEKEPAPVMYVSWDESIYGGTKAAKPAAEPEQPQPDEEPAEQPAAETPAQTEQPAQAEQPPQAETPAAETPAAPQ